MSQRANTKRFCRKIQGNPAYIEFLESRLFLSGVLFAPQASYATGSYTSGVVSGDFNGDGLPDLATVNGDSATLSVLMNTGNGNFAPGQDYATASVFNSNGHSGPYGVAAGDFDGNGSLDLVTANGPADSVSVFLNNGNGTFASHVDYTVAGNPNDVIVGDFNDDGNLDLAVADAAGNTVAILLGNGDGTFGAPTYYATGSTPTRLASGDFNGDGNLDLVVTDSGLLTSSGGHTVSVFLNKGDGTFKLKVDYTVGTDPTSVAVGDFNGDGKPDLAVVNSGSDTVSVLLGTGTGKFSARKDYATGSAPQDLVVGDFDDDGNLDLAVANKNSNNVSVLPGNGNGTFGAAVNLPSGTHPVSIAAGDFNDDGKLDLASGNGDDGSVNVFVNQSAAYGWVADAPLQTARDQFAAGVVNGQVYVFGGNAYGTGSNLSSTEVFDPTTDTWSFAADNPDNDGEGVEEVSGVALDGKFYVFGGYGGIGPSGQNGDFNFNEVYDPGTDQWAPIAPKPTVAHGGAYVVYDGEIYVFGGEYHDPESGQVSRYNVVEAYNPTTDTWRTVTHMPQTLGADTVAVVGDSAYVIGGAAFDASGNATGLATKIMRYNFSSNTWTTKGLAPMPSGRILSYDSAAPVVDGRIYVVGGGVAVVKKGDVDSFNTWVVDSVEIYDPATNTWSKGPSLPAPRGGDGIVAVGNTIYVIGGDNGTDGSSGSNGIVSNVWSWQVPPSTSVGNLSENLSPNTTLTFAASDFTAAFSDPATENTMQDVQITALPSHGKLLLNNVPVTKGQVIAVGQLGALTYTPTAGYSGTDTFGWNASDGTLPESDAAKVNLSISAVAWSTYFGGSENEGADDPSDLAIDANGDKLMGGWTESSDLPDATNSYSGADVDGFVAKFDPSGNLLWTTYIGGSDTVEVSGVAVDASGDTYVTGRADASDLPDALNSAFGGEDAFVTKLDPDGNILWSLYLGGSDDDQGQGIAVDGSGNAYITGWTQSSDFGGASGSYGGGTDAFLAKVDGDGNLQWATYFGGAGEEKTGSVAVNSTGETLIAGITGSKNLPNATNAYHGGSSDAFVAKFDASGSEQWVTYLGGSGSEAFLGGSTGYLGGVAWDTDGSAAITGFTQSSNLASARNKYNGGGDGFVSEVDASGRLLWSDYLGGGKTDVGTAVAFDGQHNVIVAGAINFTSLTANTMNIMVAKISPAGTVDFINQFGGSRNDDSGAIAVDTGGNVWITGGTWSSDFPAADDTSPPGDPSQGPDEPYNAFLAEIDASAMSQPTHLALSTLPRTLTAGIPPTLTVQVEYASGAIVDNDSSSIMVTLVAANGATLGGMTTVNAIDGVATFTGLQIDQAGTYTLSFSEAQDDLVPLISAKFTVVADTNSAHPVLSSAAPAAAVGHAFSPAIVVDEIDQFGNPVLADTSKITLGIAAGPALTLGGTTVAALKKGTASFSKAIPLAAGNYTLSLSSANSSVPTLNFFETVNQAMTTVAVPHVAASYAYGQAITINAAFKSNAPLSIPFSGTATISDMGDDFSVPGTLTANGTVKFTLPAIPANSTPYSVTISYAGDDNHLAIASDPFPLLIEPAASKLTLVPSATSLVSGQTLTLTATLSTPTDPAATHGGSVVFEDGGTPVQTLTLTGNSTAVYALVPSEGVHTFNAFYENDGNFAGSRAATKKIAVSLAPASLRGQEILLSDLAGTGDKDPPGLNLLSFSTSGNTVSNADLAFGGGYDLSYAYKQTGEATATISGTTTSGPRQSITVSLDFLTPESGTATLKYSAGQSGTSSFILLTSPIAANAPADIAGSVINLTATAGSAGLGSSGVTQLSLDPGDSNYMWVGISGSSVNSSGNYSSYTPTNAAIVSFAYVDSDSGAGTIYLAFTSPTAGVYYNVNGTNDWQSGTFTLDQASTDNA